MHPCATPDAEGRRKHPEPHDPRIPAFQADRERILRCSAFRRLDYKTQVFVPHEHDMFRTRMTHTLEVAQVARNAARALEFNEDLAEAAALAHDLGHPPFGHTGERVLDELMADHGRFEHNRQSLRIVDYLEHPYPGFRGLNLTEPTRECIAGHETAYDTPAGGEFDPSLSPPLEGQICDRADEIAYSSADLEDGLASGWISERQVSALDIWRAARDTARREYPDARDIHTRIAATRNVMRLLVDDLVATTRRTIADRDLSRPADIRRAERCAVMSPAMSGMFEQLKAFLLENLYLHPENVAEDGRSETVLRELFSAFLDDPSLLPARYRKRIDRPGEHGRIEGRHRIVCDYVAGMTDRFCRREHARITGQRAGTG